MRRRTRLLFALLAFVLSAAGVVVGSRFVRPRGDDPAGFPTARLLFGPSAVPLLVGVDGDRLLIDADSNGRFSADERHPNWLNHNTGVVIADPDGRTRYAIRHGQPYLDPKTGATRLLLWVAVQAADEYEAAVSVPVAANGAAVAHVHGPLTVAPQATTGLGLAAGDDPTDLRVWAGTFDPSGGEVTVVTSRAVQRGLQIDTEDTLPPGVRPVADVEFPPKTPGGPPVKRRFTLDAVC